MNKRLGILSVLCFVLFGINTLPAQKNYAFIGVSPGVTLPVGKFSSTAFGTGSFAQPGFTVNIEGAWFFLPKLGAGISTGINLNPVDVSSLASEKVIADPFMNDLVIRSDPYLSLTAMAGVYARLKLIKRLFFTGKLLGGLLYMQTPYQLHKPEYFLTGPSYFEITSARDWKFSWQAGSGFLYEISPCIDGLVEGMFMYDKLSFNFRTAEGIRTEIHYFTVVNVALGIRITF